MLCMAYLRSFSKQVGNQTSVGGRPLIHKAWLRSARLDAPTVSATSS